MTMIKLGSAIIGNKPRIVVGFSGETPQYVIDEANKVGLDIAEMRIDQFPSYDIDYILNEISKFKGLPTIATIRSKHEGGNFNLSEEIRLSIFKKIIPYVSSVDIELSANTIIQNVISLCHESEKIVFVSYHNFNDTPSLEKLNSICDQAKSLGADIVKIATFAKEQEDIKTLAKFTIENAEKKLVTIAMGSEGVLSRVFFPALGSLLTYAYLGTPKAPGQLPFKEMFDLLRRFYSPYNQEKI